MNIIRVRLAAHIQQGNPLALTIRCEVEDVYLYRGALPIRLILRGHNSTKVCLAWKYSAPIQETFWGDS